MKAISASKASKAGNAHGEKIGGESISQLSV